MPTKEDKEKKVSTKKNKEANEEMRKSYARGALMLMVISLITVILMYIPLIIKDFNAGSRTIFFAIAAFVTAIFASLFAVVSGLKETRMGSLVSCILMFALIVELLFFSLFLDDYTQMVAIIPTVIAILLEITNYRRSND